MKLKGAQILCESLVREGAEVIFGFPGGVVIPLYDTFAQYPKLRHILVRHEQAAAHAADGYARATGKVGVCLATSGPGATNLVTGIATAYLDSIPVVALTGQVARHLIGKDAFQEIDITGITLPITKHNFVVMKADEMAKMVKESFYIAKTGRPGPVLIDLPTDVLTEEANFVYPDKVNLPGYKPTLQGHPAQIKKAAKMIDEAKQPLIIAGHGVILSGAGDELKHLAEKAQIPVINTLLGLGSFPQTHVLSLGMIGMHGMAHVNLAVNEADLIIAIGMRFDDRATGKVSSFAPHAHIIHIDIDPAEIGKNVRVNTPIVGDIKNVLHELNKKVSARIRTPWLNKIERWQEEHQCLEIRDSVSVLPQYVVRSICDVTNGDTIMVTGVGQHQMWSAQYFCHTKPKKFISSGGLGTMGFELPASIGAQVGCPDETVWCVAGDGGFQMTIQELATIVQEKLPVKIAIFNNGYLGMVRQWQDLFYGKRYTATPLLGPDFVKVAEAYGIQGTRVTDKTQVIPAIERAMEHDGPYLIDFNVEPEENVYPMVKPGASICEFLEGPRIGVVA